MTATALRPVAHSPKSILSWEQLRGPGFHDLAPDIIAETLPDGVELAALSHIRTAHYAVYRAAVPGGKSWIVRIGLASEKDSAPADNTGFQGTSTFSPTGQLRELSLAYGFAAAGAAVATPSHYVRHEGLDILWIPYLVGSDRPLTASQWHETLTGLHSYRPGVELPVFTNRAKSFARLDELPDHLTVPLRNRYDTALEALFEAATSWSTVHGDAHAGNALNVDGKAVLFDFDTACWAPSVWDLTHLLNRAGRGGNIGYSAKELAGLFPFTATEVHAAVELRKVAAMIAKAHREHRVPLQAAA